MKAMYTKVWVHDELGTRITQKVITPISINEHGNVTAKYYNEKIKEYETRVFKADEVSETPYLMEFN